MRFPTIALVAVAIALCVARSASTQDTGTRSRPSVTTTTPDSALEAKTRAVALTLRCPVCQGESIEDSPSGLARQMRAVVRERLRSGETPDEVKAYFASKYGEWILLEPTMSGLNILLYVFPVLLVVGGLALVAFLVRRWTTPEANTQ
ncbi:MAG TPA: cytochrome c-type biogenesis protein [Gemmatimonadaceae bacterium]|nr:cytochrome c-type biogenesis protein [Gemmatimonadaceae bacterium]